MGEVITWSTTYTNLHPLEICWLRFPNFNVLHLPGAQVHNVHNFLPQNGRFNFISIFIIGKNLFNNIENSSKEPHEVADEIEKLAHNLLQLANFVYVIAIPPRGEIDPITKWKAKTTNDLTKLHQMKQGKKGRQWMYRESHTNNIFSSAQA